MKIITLILLLIHSTFPLAQYTDNNTIIIDKENLLGRWTEINRTDIDGSKLNLNYKDSYIFKEDLCHRGEVTTGIILYDITARYKVESNIINITYFDLLSKRNVPKNTVLRLKLTIISLSDDEMRAHVKDHTFAEYFITLKKTTVK